MEKTITVKSGRTEIELSEKDEVMFNGACYQVITKRRGYGFNSHTPVLAKSRAKSLIKSGNMVFDRKESGMVEVDIYRISI